MKSTPKLIATLAFLALSVTATADSSGLSYLNPYFDNTENYVTYGDSIYKRCKRFTISETGDLQGYCYYWPSPGYYWASINLNDYVGNSLTSRDSLDWNSSGFTDYITLPTGGKERLSCRNTSIYVEQDTVWLRADCYYGNTFLGVRRRQKKLNLHSVLKLEKKSGAGGGPRIEFSTR
ncbi:MAG: hypothetical protein OXB88_08320 [Bacteriovoracales bacterium]|nr:hypothetical protein [Bacteriovoracales bacterium]